MSAVKNDLINRLPLHDRTRLLALCEPVPLLLSQVLCEPDAPTTHVYFPTQGFISLVSQVDAHPGLEVGMVGREGMVGVQVVLGLVDLPLQVLVQGQGAALRVPVQPFMDELALSPAMKKYFDRYAFVRLAQT
ncbi:MAG: Crp/Fnr family transcriptional regulator, partial [Rubrivivax sp.]|nr:Crp/Fnr family transcriptional regulator [Rubrivivax sp.]